jgi:polyisoprenoid-binding protein YceI
MFLRALALLVLVAAPLHAASWVVAPETSVTVAVPWRGLTIDMRFPDIEGTVEFDERRPDRTRAQIAVAAGSVRTGLPPADRLARSQDFLAAEAYPTIGFRLDRLTQTSPSTADIEGRITFRGVTRPIAFKARVFRYGPAEDDSERFEAGFQLDGSIDRTEFGAMGALREVPARLPVRIRLLLSSS